MAQTIKAGKAEHDYDVITIGLGPAGMMLSGMAAEMGLKVCAIEKDKVGGECMNIGCIPSKAILRTAKARHGVNRFPELALEKMPLPLVQNPFDGIQESVRFIREQKIPAKLHKVHMILQKGAAFFVDSHTVEVGGRRISGKRIFICTGTKPWMPPIPGLENIDAPLTNENIFHLATIPESMLIIGGGAIGCEMAQAFSRLGCRVAIVQKDAHLLPFADPVLGQALEAVLVREGVEIYNNRNILKLEQKTSSVVLTTREGETLEGNHLLVAAGRFPSLQGLKLENAGVRYGKPGIFVNGNLQTSIPHIYAVGDCNGEHLFSHAAMHQAMIALMNILRPRPFRKSFRKYVVPWTIFTDPQISQVGREEKDLKAAGISYEVLETAYADYGAAIAENVTEGFVRVLASKGGKIYGAAVVGEGSAEMINLWGLAIQKKLRLPDILMLQHSFPSMSCLNKSIAEMWMMRRMQLPLLQRIVRKMMRR